jgi:carbon-monoxide dehydrogenase small subunit
MTQMRLRVNGKVVTDDVPPRLSLADFLRERRNLTGTHLGCEHGVCGACTILIDGEPARSCLTFAVACEGREVRTIEGFGDDPIMAALRLAFHQHHGLQCGFCTPGMLITAYDLIRRGRARSETEIRQGLAGNVCRCTGYTNIVAAIGAAAQALAAETDAPAAGARQLEGAAAR